MAGKKAKGKAKKQVKEEEIEEDLIENDEEEEEEEEDFRPKRKTAASMFAMLSVEDDDSPRKAPAKAKKGGKQAKAAKSAQKEREAEVEEEQPTAAPAKMSKIEKRAAQKQKKAANKKVVLEEDSESEEEEEEEEEEQTTKKGRKAKKSKSSTDGKKKTKKKKTGKSAEEDIRDWPSYVRLKESGVNAKKRLIRDIKADDFVIQVPGQVLIKQASLTLVEGQSYGVLGRNGIGKSVLLKRLAHREEPFDKVPDYIRILFVEQEITGDDTTPLNSVLHADEEREWLLAEEKRLVEKARIEEEAQAKRDARGKEREEAIAKGLKPETEEEEEEEEVPDRSYDLRDIYERLREIDSAKAEARASTILAGLGFTMWDIRNKTTKEFSGGWRMRIALARALFVSPDLLILDEPTNHLDLNAVIWLESYLENYKKTLLVVSHERVFLSAVAKNIIHFHNQTLTTYKGDYYMFLKVRASNQRSQTRAQDAQEKRVKKLKDFINKDKNKGGGQANSRKLMLKNMEKINVDTDDALIKFEFPEPLSLGCGEGVSILQFQEVSFGYTKEKIIFHNLDFGLDLESRVALVGPNGVGKSTVLKLMTGQLEPTTGYVYRHRNLMIARFSQHHVDQLNMEMNPVEYLQNHFPEAQTQDVRKHLGGFGLPGKLALTAIDKLSGGQKSRVVLAELAWRKPHILLLDEPTNHLDIEMIDSLGEALKNFGGGLVLVSHNQRLIELCCNQLWVVGRDGTVTRYEAEFEDYKQQVIDEINQLIVD